MYPVKHILLLILLVSLTAVNSVAQHNISLPKNSEPGKCYAKCAFYTKRDTTIQEFYTAKESVPAKKSWFKETILELDPTYQYWIIRISNEVSTEQFVFEESKSIEKIKIKTLKGKALQKLVPSQVDTLKFAISWKSYYNDKWEEVLCADKFNNELWLKLSQKLKDAGYLNQNHKVGHNGRDETIIDALKSFQNETFGHFGTFSKETFEKLGLEEYFSDEN